MINFLVRQLFPTALILFVTLLILEWFLPGFATNHINMTMFAVALVVLGILTVRSKAS